MRFKKKLRGILTTERDGMGIIVMRERDVIADGGVVCERGAIRRRRAVE